MITTAKMSATPKIAFRAAIDPKESPFAPWSVAAEDFPRNGSTHDKWKFLLRYAILAPSSHNTQPWLFRLRGGEAELYADRTRACRVVDPDDRELVMSCGCALFHLRSALLHFGCFGGVEILPDANDSELLARVNLGVQGESSAGESLIFHAIPKFRLILRVGWTRRNAASRTPALSGLQRAGRALHIYEMACRFGDG